MKKIIALFVCLQILSSQALALDVIKDDFAEQTLKSYKNQKYGAGVVFIEDNLLDKDFYKNAGKLEKKKLEPVYDNFALESFKGKKIEFPKPYLDYDYTSIEKYPVKLKVAQYISTKQGLNEGSSLIFYTYEDAKLPNGVVIPKNSEVSARLETVAKNGAMGVPADMIVSNFTLQNYQNIKLVGTIEKTGANRALWVYPVGYAGIYFFGLGLLLFAVRGGHAKMKPGEIYTVYSK